MHPRVKVCGITRALDAWGAAQSGADAIGLVFYPPSPRAVTVAQAQEIVAALPPLVSVVALFVNPSVAEVTRVLQQLPIAWLQFHGDEDNAFCHQFKRPFYKALRMKPGVDLRERMVSYVNASGFLLDAYVKDKPGGTGATFDWHKVPLRSGISPSYNPTDVSQKPIILAGGLTPDNVAQAIQIAQPYALDVSSGVEQTPGIKDAEKVERFIRQAKSQWYADSD